jgi:hypothetical protein
MYDFVLNRDVTLEGNTIIFRVKTKEECDVTLEINEKALKTETHVFNNGSVEHALYYFRHTNHRDVTFRFKFDVLSWSEDTPIWSEKYVIPNPLHWFKTSRLEPKYKIEIHDEHFVTFCRNLKRLTRYHSGWIHFEITKQEIFVSRLGRHSRIQFSVPLDSWSTNLDNHIFAFDLDITSLDNVFFKYPRAHIFQLTFTHGLLITRTQHLKTTPTGSNVIAPLRYRNDDECFITDIVDRSTKYLNILSI